MSLGSIRLASSGLAATSRGGASSGRSAGNSGAFCGSGSPHVPLADPVIVSPFHQVEMDVVLVVPVRARAEHGREPRAGGMQHTLAHPRGTVRSVSEIVLPSTNLKARTSSALARPCSESCAPTTRLRPRHSNESKLSEIGDGGAEALRQRRDITANPVGQCCRHLTAQDRRRFYRNLPLVRQHDRLQPHQILAPAAAGALDVGDTGRNGDFVCQRQRQADCSGAVGAACSGLPFACSFCPGCRGRRKGPRPGAVLATGRPHAAPCPARVAILPSTGRPRAPGGMLSLRWPARLACQAAAPPPRR